MTRLLVWLPRKIAGVALDIVLGPAEDWTPNNDTRPTVCPTCRK